MGVGLKVLNIYGIGLFLCGLKRRAYRCTGRKSIGYNAYFLNDINHFDIDTLEIQPENMLEFVYSISEVIKFLVILLLYYMSLSH